MHVERELEPPSEVLLEEDDDVRQSELKELHNNDSGFYDVPPEVLESQRRLIPTYQAMRFASIIRHPYVTSL